MSSPSRVVEVSAIDVALVAASGVVDDAWYSEMYPDVAAAGVSPLVHYLSQGWLEGRDPGPAFSSTHYLSAYPDVVASGMNPLVHYVTQGWREGRTPRTAFDVVVPPHLHDFSPLSVELAGLHPQRVAVEVAEQESLPSLAARASRPAARPPAAAALRTVAFYLPQFHPIPENDAWWGTGFTEWTNVVNGRPLFDGHHQPHVPGELGYYDLRDPAVMRRQTELAKLHGLTAFCFYAYWFGGDRLLERPLDAYLADPSLNLDFCVCWANENWTRTWNGAEDDVLMSQRHSPEDDLAFIAEMSDYLKDPRYLRVDGRPLLLVYRPSLLPDPASTARRWRSWCRENGVGEILLAYVQSFDKVPPADFGFDFAVEFPPNNTGPDRLPSLEATPGFEGQVYDWADLAARSESYGDPGYPLWRGVCTSWDNTARRGVRSAILWGAEPERFRDWVVNAGRDTILRLPVDQRLVFVNAWNEWAEGAHLEPDDEFGYQWLHALRDAQALLAGATLSDRGPGVVVVTHDLHEHGAQLLAHAIVAMLGRLGVAVETVALGHGELMDAFRTEAPLHVLPSDEGEEADRLAADLVARGFTTALCNTSVSGKFAAALRRAGADVSGLVHELPSVLADPALASRAESLAKMANRIWFPAAKVEADYPFELDPGCAALVRPQGVYRTIRGRASVAARGRLRQMLGLPADASIVLGVGYGDHRKGLDIFARAAASRPHTSEGSPLHFVWVGRTDSFDPRITEALAAAGSDRLHLAGFVDEPQPYYEGADVLALPSREDPFPSVVLEALLVGLPVVAFRGRTGQDELLDRLGCHPVEEASAGSLVAGLVAAVEEDSAVSADRRAAAVADDFNFRRYVMDVLAPTPAAIPRVSVVVPNYAYEHLIGSRIAQILDQSYPVYELVVLDDASPDGSVEAIKAAVSDTDVPVLLRLSEVNSGSVFAQWTAGVALTTGDVVWIAEADDVADPRFLETLVPEVAREGVVVAYCQSRQLGQEGQVLAADYRGYVADIGARDWTRRYVSTGEDEITNCLAVRNTVPNVSAVLFQGDVLRDVLPAARLGDLPTAGDWYVYVEMLRRGGIAFVPQALNDHRRHAASVIASNLGREHLVEIMSMQARIAADFDVPPAAREQAIRYDEQLFEQFGLGDASAMRAEPALAPLAAAIEGCPAPGASARPSGTRQNG